MGGVAAHMRRIARSLQAQLKGASHTLPGVITANVQVSKLVVGGVVTHVRRIARSLQAQL